MDPSTIALRERSAIELVDHFIDSQLTKHDANHRITLLELLRFLNPIENPASKTYIGTAAESTLKFIELRSYLWKVEEINYLKKQSPEWRSLFVDVLELLQKRGLKKDRGATLHTLGCHIGACAPSIKRELGKGNEGIKSTLLQYPSLFVLDPFGKEPTFVNRAMVVDKVILLPEVYKFSNPAYLEGVGSVMNSVGETGVLKDDASGDSISFKAAEVSGLPPDQKKFRVNRKYRFKAVISADFADKKTENKWTAFYMVSAVDPLAASPVVVAPVPNLVGQSVATGTSDSFLPSLKDHLTDPWLTEVSTRLSKLDEGISKLSVKAKVASTGATLSSTSSSAIVDHKGQGATAIFREETMAVGKIGQSAKAHMVTSTAKRDRTTQTDPIDEREQIIRMLHKNPELIGFVKTYIRAVEH